MYVQQRTMAVMINELIHAQKPIVGDRTYLLSQQQMFVISVVDPLGPGG